MTVTVKMAIPTRPSLLAEFAKALSGARHVLLNLPGSGSNRAPNLVTLEIVGNLLQHASSVRTLTLALPFEDASFPRSLARAGFWAAMHQTTAVVKAHDERVIDTLRAWNPVDGPLGQVPLYASEVQWRPTTGRDLSSRRLEYKVGYIDRPEQRQPSFETADMFASTIADEIIEVAAGAARDTLTEDGVQCLRLLAQGVSTLVENVGEHAFDVNAVPEQLRAAIDGRDRRSALLITMTRGGGSGRRPSQNRLRLTVRDNGVSIPATVRWHQRFGGITDSQAIADRLLTRDASAAESDLKGLGYPDLVKVAVACLRLGWWIDLDVVTQDDAGPANTLLARYELRSQRESDQAVRTTLLRDVPFVGTSASVTILVPGSPTWLGELRGH